mmetsp:Transcript_26310/g.36219  ORF Transcript_26310/g.36219 Transcript_26310/m.36219 type:complete len:263 (-) Transcript_26310:478-1266(-)
MGHSPHLALVQLRAVHGQEGLQGQVTFGGEMGPGEFLIFPEPRRPLALHGCGGGPELRASAHLAVDGRQPGLHILQPHDPVAPQIRAGPLQINFFEGRLRPRGQPLGPGALRLCLFCCLMLRRGLLVRYLLSRQGQDAVQVLHHHRGRRRKALLRVLQGHGVGEDRQGQGPVPGTNCHSCFHEVLADMAGEQQLVHGPHCAAFRSVHIHVPREQRRHRRNSLGLPPKDFRLFLSNSIQTIKTLSKTSTCLMRSSLQMHICYP